MKNYSTINEFNFKLLDKEQAKAELAVETIKAKRLALMETLNTISFHDLNKCFETLKLDVKTDNIQQFGTEIEDFKTKGVRIALVATPLPGCKIKPLFFKAYTKSGSSTNKPRCKEKAEELKAKIKELTGLDSSINEYSFELESNETVNDFRILIDLQIPNPNCK